MWGPQGWKSWGVQPAMFNDVPHEQIDWAELAKQWIEMQKTPQVENVPPPPPPLPLQAPPPVSLPPPPEQIPPGTEVYPTKPLHHEKLSPETYHDHIPYESKADFETKEEVPFWTDDHWDSGPPGDVDFRQWIPPAVEPTPTIMGGKETFDYGHMHDNAPLAMQSIDYNHMSEYSYNPPFGAHHPPQPNQYDQYWSQVNAAPPNSISPVFLKKQRSSSSVRVEETPSLDAAKRKTLPVWIREGLEKMEHERVKKMEKEKVKENVKAVDAKEDSPVSDVPIRSKFESESEEEEEVPTMKTVPVLKRAPSPEEDTRTEEEKKQELIIRVRRMLTEILLSVTNSEMVSIAQEVYRKAKVKAPARQLASTASSATVASGLSGLASYGTESESSEDDSRSGTDSEEELYRRIREKKRQFAVMEKKILAELERKEAEQKTEEKVKKENNRVATEKVAPMPSESPSNEPNEDGDSLSASKSSPDSAPLVNDTGGEEENNEVVSEDVEIHHPHISPTKDDPKSSPSDSSSSSSDSSSVSNGKEKRKKHKSSKKTQSEMKKISKHSKSPSKHSSRQRRSGSKDSSSSENYRSEKKSSKKKKKYKRSSSSSSSETVSRHRKNSEKSISSRNHKDYRRSHSVDDHDRKRRRSASPSKSHRKSDSYSYRSSRPSRYEDDRHDRYEEGRNERYEEGRHERYEEGRHERYKEGKHERYEESRHGRHEESRPERYEESRHDRYEESKHDRYEERHKEERSYYISRRSPSPYSHCKVPKQYRISRSPSSESERYGKKWKKSRNR